MSVQTPADKSSPLWLAWKLYTTTGEYANTKRWAISDPARYVDGALWSAFVEGFNSRAALTREPTP